MEVVELLNTAVHIIQTRKILTPLSSAVLDMEQRVVQFLVTV